MFASDKFIPLTPCQTINSSLHRHFSRRANEGPVRYTIGYVICGFYRMTTAVYNILMDNHVERDSYKMWLTSCIGVVAAVTVTTWLAYSWITALDFVFAAIIYYGAFSIALLNVLYAVVGVVALKIQVLRGEQNYKTPDTQNGSDRPKIADDDHSDANLSHFARYFSSRYRWRQIPTTPSQFVNSILNAYFIDRPRSLFQCLLEMSVLRFYHSATSIDAWLSSKVCITTGCDPFPTWAASCTIVVVITVLASVLACLSILSLGFVFHGALYYTAIGITLACIFLGTVGMLVFGKDVAAGGDDNDPSNYSSSCTADVAFNQSASISHAKNR